jgi:hypothetical protein
MTVPRPFFEGAIVILDFDNRVHTLYRIGKIIDTEIQMPNQFTVEMAKEIGEKLGVDWSQFDVEQFRMGMDIELEHGLRDPDTNVTNNDPLITGKIALAHLKEFPDYYTRLEKLEEVAKEKKS